MNSESKPGLGISAEVRALVELSVDDFERLTIKLGYWLVLHGVDVKRVTVERALLDVIESEVGK